MDSSKYKELRHLDDSIRFEMNASVSEKTTELGGGDSRFSEDSAWKNNVMLIYANHE